LISTGGKTRVQPAGAAAEPAKWFLTAYFLSSHMVFTLLSPYKPTNSEDIHRFTH
jgi:hypothetical protein